MVFQALNETTARDTSDIISTISFVHAGQASVAFGVALIAHFETFTSVVITTGCTVASVVSLTSGDSRLPVCLPDRS